MSEQIKKIQSAKRAYLYNITPQSKLYRFAVYLDLENDEALSPLWPDRCDKGKEADLLPLQVYSTRDRATAAYHFKCNWPEDLVKELHKINPKLQVFVFEGGAYLHEKKAPGYR